MKKLPYLTKTGDRADLTYTKIHSIFRQCYSEEGVFKNDKLSIIKNIVHQLPCGLREAKEIVDTFIFIQKQREWLEYVPFQHIIAGMNCKLMEEEFMYG